MQFLERQSFVERRMRDAILRYDAIRATSSRTTTPTRLLTCLVGARSSSDSTSNIELLRRRHAEIRQR